MSADKSEAPSRKKKQDSRDKGDVPHSKDLTQAVLVVAVLSYLMLRAAAITSTLAELVVAPAAWLHLPLHQALPLAWMRMSDAFVQLLGPIIAIVFLLGLLSDGLQVGALIAWKKLNPSLKRLNAVDNVKNVFSKKNLIEFLKSIVKIAFLGALAALVLRDSLSDLLLLPEGNVGIVAQALGSMLGVLLWNIAAAYGTIGLIDFFWQRTQFTKGIMMSKDEVKRERKDSDGDPLIKEKRRNLRHEAAEEAPGPASTGSSVLVTNPTHVAIGLYYDPTLNRLPRITAKAHGAAARRLRETARRAGIPIVEDVPLARALLAWADIGDDVPNTLLEPVANVLRGVSAPHHLWNPH